MNRYAVPTTLHVTAQDLAHARGLAMAILRTPWGARIALEMQEPVLIEEGVPDPLIASRARARQTFAERRIKP